MNDNLNIYNIISRMGEETPDYWKAIKRLMIFCGAMGGAILAAEGVTDGIIPEWVWETGKILTFVGIVGAGLAQTAKK